MKVGAVVVAAGRGVRMGGERPKQLLELEGKPILAWTLAALLESKRLDTLVVAAPPGLVGETRRLITSVLAERAADLCWVEGGAQRQDSVANGLQALPEELDWVLIHDGVRPFVSTALIERTLDAARHHGAAICALPATDTVKQVSSGTVTATLPRDEIYLVQTPQVFRRRDLLEAHRRARDSGRQATDDAALIEHLGVTVGVVAGDPLNRKLTTPEDLAWARWLIGRRAFAEPQ